MLNRIRIQGYKSLRDVEVRLKPLSVLFGPNAAGKSNFLDALQLLSRIVSSRTLKEAFEPPYRGKPLESFTLGADGIKGLLAQESLSFSIEVDFTLSEAIVEAVEPTISRNRQVDRCQHRQDRHGGHQPPICRSAETRTIPRKPRRAPSRRRGTLPSATCATGS